MRSQGAEFFAEGIIGFGPRSDLPDLVVALREFLLAALERSAERQQPPAANQGDARKWATTALDIWVNRFVEADTIVAVLSREARALGSAQKSLREYRDALAAAEAVAPRPGLSSAQLDECIDLLGTEVERRDAPAFVPGADDRFRIEGQPPRIQYLVHLGSGWFLGPEWFVALEAYVEKTRAPFDTGGTSWWKDPAVARKRWRAAFTAAGFLAAAETAHRTGAGATSRPQKSKP